MLPTAGLIVALAFAPASADSGPVVDWTREGPLGDVARHVSSRLPLSDQAGVAAWVPDPAFTDEFEGSALDERWHVPPGEPEDGLGRAPSLFRKENVSLGHGMLRIVFRKEQTEWMRRSNAFFYTTGLVRSRARTLYGYYETRAKAMNSSASSAFWLSYTGLEKNQTEIDIFEIGGKTKAQQFDRQYHMHAHVWVTPDNQPHRDIGSAWLAPWRLAEDFHVYGFDWQPHRLRWYVDGVLVREASNTDWHYPMQVIFDSEAFWDWFGPVDDADLPSTFEVDYLRVWRHAQLQ